MENRLDTILRSVIIFVVGVISTEAVRILLTDVGEWTVVTLVIAVLLLTVFVIAYMTIITTQVTSHTASIAEDVESHLASSPFSVSTALTDDQINRGYERMSAVIQRADHSIYVLSALLTEEAQIKVPASRSKYLEAIENAIRDRLQDQDTSHPPLTYVRVLQSRTEPFTAILKRGQVDPETFEHCRRVDEMVRDSNKITFRLYIRRPVIGCPSLLIVDEEYVDLGILGSAKQYDKKTLSPTYVHSVQGMVNIRDFSKGVPSYYASLLDKLMQYEQKIETYDPPLT